jgi:hypothetical protein
MTIDNKQNLEQRASNRTATVFALALASNVALGFLALADGIHNTSGRNLSEYTVPYRVNGIPVEGHQMRCVNNGRTYACAVENEVKK